MKLWLSFIAAVVALTVAVLAHGDVQWSRFKGKVKAVNGKAATVTIQNAEGDLVTVKVDSDVEVLRGKDQVKLGDVAIDDKVTLVYSPKAPPPKESDEEPALGGVYAPVKR